MDNMPPPPAKSPTDMAALVAEVERLQDALAFVERVDAEAKRSSDGNRVFVDTRDWEALREKARAALKGTDNAG
jgi:hypothetical protein